MKLLIISGMPHYYRDGKIVGWGATAQEISYLANLFEHITHIARLYKEEAPKTALPYDSEKITFVPTKPTGGDGLLNKIKILLALPAYVAAILKYLPNADAVHVRCPDNISLVAIVLISFFKNPRIRWVKYAGNWNPEGKEPWSYKFQRWWLRNNLYCGVVTVNGKWPDQPEHVHSFPNPCLSVKELEEARRLVKGKILSEPLRFVFVGRIEEAKGVGRALKILDLLKQRNISFSADLIGDGPQRSYYEAEAQRLRLPINFQGWLPKYDLSKFYAKAHFILMPSTASEGWPKVLSEAMAYGCIPLTSNISSIPQYLAELGVGRSMPITEVKEFNRAIESYIQNPNTWDHETEVAQQASKNFTYENYLVQLKNILGL